MREPASHFTDLIAHRRAIEAAAIVLPLAARVRAPFRSLAEQVIRSCPSVANNLAEGDGRTGADRLHTFQIAYAEAKESSSSLSMLIASGCIDAERGERALELLDEVRALTWRLMHPKP